MVDVEMIILLSIVILASVSLGYFFGAGGFGR